MVTDSKFETKEIAMPDAIAELEEYHAQFTKLKNDAARYNRYEETLNLAMTRFENVENLEI